MKRTILLLLCVCLLLLSIPQHNVEAMSSAFDHSDSYRQSAYYANLLEVELTGNYRKDIVAVALSQVGYHEGGSRSDTGGSSSGNKNYTEYGKNFGLEGDSWCAVFVWWCARQAGVQESVIHKTEWAKTRLQPFECLPFEQCTDIQPGDIVYVDTSGNDGREDHVGIVASVSENEIITVEGNSSNKVTKHTYSRTSGKRLTGSDGVWLLSAGSPDYGGENISYASYSTLLVYAPGAQAYSSVGGSKTAKLGTREYMLLSADPTAEWIQIVAQDGLGTWVVRSEGVTYVERDLPPITGYDAWSALYPTAAPSAVTGTEASIATTAAVTTAATAATTTATTTTAATTVTEPSAADMVQPTTAPEQQEKPVSDADENTTETAVPTEPSVPQESTGGDSGTQPQTKTGAGQIVIFSMIGVAGVAISACAAGSSRRKRRR